MNIFSCEKKKNNKLPGRSYGGHKASRRSGGLKRSNTTERFDAAQSMQCQIIEAPEEGPNMLVWKWDVQFDKYDYKGCTPQLEISHNLPPGPMDAFFEDIKSIKDYSHKGLGNYIGNCMCAWCIICYIPFLCYGCCYAAMWWEGVYNNHM